MARSLADDMLQTLRDAAPGDDRSATAVDAALELLGRVQRATAPDAESGQAWWETEPTALLWDEFLAAHELSALCDYVMARRADFTPATLIDAERGMAFVDPSFRLSESLFVLGPFRSLFERRILHYLDFACGRLDRPPFEHPWIELQLTATRNGGFFRRHDDNSHRGNRSRRLTFVYYFFVEPFRRSGGALRFHPRDALSEPLDILPAQNRMIVFDSSLHHEVRPYHSESDAFEKARFTVNGWVHQETWP